MPTPPAFWDQLADKYAAQPVEDPQAFERKIAFTRQALRPDSRVLEVGCGTGSLALRLIDACGRYDALDYSEQMLRIARDKAQGTPTLRFHQSTLEDAPFPDASFDVALAFSILHLVPERAAFLARLHALLKPGGQLISSTTCIGNTWAPLGAAIWVLQRLGKAPWVADLSTSTMRTELEEAGFQEVEEVDVGAKDTVVFLAARKPLA